MTVAGASYRETSRRVQIQRIVDTTLLSDIMGQQKFQFKHLTRN